MSSSVSAPTSAAAAVNLAPVVDVKPKAAAPAAAAATSQPSTDTFHTAESKPAAEAQLAATKTPEKQPVKKNVAVKVRSWVQGLLHRKAH